MKHLPFTTPFPLDYKKILKSRLLPKSKNLFDLSAPGQGLIINIDLENDLIIMVPAYNKGDAENKEWDKNGKLLPEFIRSLTTRKRGIINPQSTGGNLHKQVDELYGLAGKPRLGLGVWKDERGGIDELTIVSTLQMFAIQWRRGFREFFKLLTHAHVTHTESLLREVPYEIFKFIYAAIYNELGLKRIPIDENPAISAMTKLHFAIQREWRDHFPFCLRRLFVNLIYNKEEKLIAEIINDQQKEAEFKDEENTQIILEEARNTARLLSAASTGDIHEFNQALSYVKTHNFTLIRIILLETGDNALTLAAKYGHKDIIQEIIHFLDNVQPDQNQIYECKNTFRKSPLFLAVEEGHLDCVKLLILYTLNSENFFHAYIKAIKQARLPIIEEFLKYYQDYFEILGSCRDEHGRNPLMIAVVEGNLEVVTLINQYYPQFKYVNLFDNECCDLLTLSIKYKRRLITEYLFRNGTSIEIAYHSNLQKKDYDVLKEILHYYGTGSSSNGFFKFLHDQLKEAVFVNNEDLFNLLLSFLPLEHRAKSISILNTIVEYDRVNFLKVYLKFMENSKEEKCFKQYLKADPVNALYIAFEHENWDCFKLLLNKGIFTFNDFEKALQDGSVCFIECITDFIVPTLSYFSISMIYDNPYVVQLLSLKLPHINYPLDQKGTSVLILAIEHEAIKTVSHLIKNNKADPGLSDFKGKSPLLYAARTGNWEIFKLILQGTDYSKLELIKFLERARKNKNYAIVNGLEKELRSLALLEINLSKNAQTLLNNNSANPSVSESIKLTLKKTSCLT